MKVFWELTAIRFFITGAVVFGLLRFLQAFVVCWFGAQYRLSDLIVYLLYGNYRQIFPDMERQVDYGDLSLADSYVLTCAPNCYNELGIIPQDPDDQEPYTNFYAYDLMPNTTYNLQMQCSEAKGCEEHLSPLSQAYFVFTPEGEPADSKHLTLAYDSINYDPATHVIYLPQALTGGSVNINSAEGELVKSIPLSAHHNVIPLNDDEFQRGSVYLIKYLPDNKMGRKSPWIKILFR